MLVFKDHKLGEIDKDFQIETKEENAQASIMMTQQCKQSLDIISRDMDPFIYDHMEFIEALRKLALKGRHTRIRILLYDINSIISRGHRMIEVASRFSSFIEMRKLATEFKDFNEGLLIADETAFIYRKNAGRYEAKLNFNDKRQSKHFIHAFNEMWQTARPDPNLRRVTI